MKTYSGPPESNRLTFVSCNFCGSEKTDPMLMCDGFNFVQCLNCGLVYQNPRPSAGIVHDRYDEDYFLYERRNEESFFHLMKLGLADIGFSKIENEFTGEKKFLDIGCATGMLLAYVKGRGWSEQGVEVCEPSARYGREERNVRIHSGPLEDTRFNADSFQIIHCSHLVEHLEDPQSLFQEVHRILQPGGYFIITTPNIDSLQAKKKKGDWRSAIADHLFLFSRATLDKYLRKNGFTLLRWKSWGGIPNGEAPAVIKTMADRLVKLFGWGDVMIFLARKTEY